MSDIRKDLLEAAQGLEVYNSTANGELPPERDTFAETDVSFDSQSETVEDDEEEDLPQSDVEEAEEDATSDSLDDSPSEETPSEPVQTSSEEDIPEPLQWAAEMRQHWKSLPSDVRKYINAREAQQHAYISKVGSQFGELRKAYGEVDKALKPFETDMQKFGLSRGQLVERLLTERGEMMKDPAAFIKRFADMNRLNLQELANDPELNEPPEVRQARWQLKDQERALEEQRQAILERQQQVQVDQLTQFIEGWGSQRPHFAEVRQAMAQILPEIQQSYPYLDFEQQLETSYNAALRHPNFTHLARPKPVPPQVKKAANGLNGSSGVPTKSREPASIREALLQAAKETGFF
jgi:hypothetical protein